MSFCESCGASLPEEGLAKFCGACGAPLGALGASLPRTESPPSAYTTSSENIGTVALWNPNAAASWSLLFTPVFGSYLNRQNWLALGRPERAKTSLTWLWISVAVVCVVLAAPQQAAFGITFWYLIIWYFASGRKQATYVSNELGNRYVRKGWGKPVAAAVGAFFVLFFVLALALALVVGDGQSASAGAAQESIATPARPASVAPQQQRALPKMTEQEKNKCLNDANMFVRIAEVRSRQLGEQRAVELAIQDMEKHLTEQCRTYALEMGLFN